jgi:hypothetical protein
VNARHRPFEDRWTPLAGAGTLGASYLPCCPARLAAGAEWGESRARLSLLWSERAAALRFRRAVLAARATRRTLTETRLTLARLQREAFAYEAGSARLRRIEQIRMGWLIRRLRARQGDPVIGAAFATMSAELAVLALAHRIEDARQSDVIAASLSA